MCSCKRHMQLIIYGDIYIYIYGVYQNEAKLIGGASVAHFFIVACVVERRTSSGWIVEIHASNRKKCAFNINIYTIM